MIHTNRCKHCGKTKEEHVGNGHFCSLDVVENPNVNSFKDSGLAALDAHKEELYEAVNEYVEAKKEEKQNRGNTNGRLIGVKIKDAYQRLESILNQIEKEK